MTDVKKKNRAESIKKAIHDEMVDNIQDELIADIKTEINDDIIKLKAELKTELDEEMEIFKGSLSIQMDLFKGTIKKRLISDSEIVKQSIIEDIRDEISKTFNAEINDTKKNIQKTIKEQLNKVMDELKINIEQDINTELEKFKKYSANELKNNITNNIRETLQDDISAALNNSDFAIEVDTGRINNSKPIMVAGVQPHDAFKLIKLLSKIDNEEIIGEIANEPTPLIIGSIKEVLEGNIVEYDRVTYCMFDTGLLGSVICQMVALPYYAKKQVESTYNNETLGKIIQEYSTYIYLDSKGNISDESSYNAYMKKKKKPVGVHNHRIHNPTNSRLNKSPRPPIRQKNSLDRHHSPKCTTDSEIQTDAIVKMALVKYEK